MNKWMNRIATLCLGDIFGFVCVLSLPLGLFGVPNTGGSPLAAIIGLEVVECHAGGEGTGVEGPVEVLGIGAQLRGDVLSDIFL